MNWTYTAIRLPSADDADENGNVMCRGHNGVCFYRRWSDLHHSDCYGDYVAWLPVPKFVPLPKLPDGYELLKDYDLEPDSAARVLLCNEWREQHKSTRYYKDMMYCIPSSPPWVPVIVTAGVLRPGTWVCIDDDGGVGFSKTKPTWDCDTGWMGANFEALGEVVQLTGNKAIWEVKNAT